MYIGAYLFEREERGEARDFVLLFVLGWVTVILMGLMGLMGLIYLNPYNNTQTIT